MSGELEGAIIEKARDLGADLAGIASADTLRSSPSHRLAATVGTRIDGEYAGSANRDHVPLTWYAPGRSVVVIALAHPENKPELDWSHSSGNTPGNSVLMRISRELSAWIEGAESVKTYPMHYYVERGGVYLKDAAVLAGLGCLGKNNLLVTPQFGPRVRLRAMVLDAELQSTGPVDFDPCESCPEYCRGASPCEAFNEAVRLPDGIGIRGLPARDAFYRRSRCLAWVHDEWRAAGVVRCADTTNGMENEHTSDDAGCIVKHCRRCELTCPVGNNQSHG